MTVPVKIYLKDYTPPSFSVPKTQLDIRLYEDHAIVTSTLYMQRKHIGELVLFGTELELIDIYLNDKKLNEADYVHNAECLIINNAPDTVKITSTVKITPQTNTTLEGLYQAGKGVETMFVTQCEPEGFRRITFFPDRPDVLSEYTIRVEADKKFPILLANGNLIDKGEVDAYRHFAIWHDPTLKPSYLVACVIADLDVMSDSFTTMDGKDVLLQIYADARDIDKCHIAMTALKDAMVWDEEHYGRAYDLDRYMIVATPQFNMGAMENKGLNIFNTSCVLASPTSATDERSFWVKSVIAHEYFHNWTGNRITCRDWFQLCLKEGLTVYRDQSFSASQRSSAVQRIEDVARLKAAQFPEDAGPLAHAVRPDSFIEINNFYTMTVYEKGAEIVRMIATFMGQDNYRRGMDAYFERHDGQAVTIEDFLSALAVADARVMKFLPWYTQPGTPVLLGRFDTQDDAVHLFFSQMTRQVAGYAEPQPLPIPIDVAIFHGVTGELLCERILLLEKDTDVFIFDNLCLGGVRPIVSVLRNFSAPVRLEFEYSDEELAGLIGFEQEGFNRWQAMQMLFSRVLMSESDNIALVIEALKLSVRTLIDSDPMLAARLFDIPSQKELAANYDADYHPVRVKQKRDEIKASIAVGLVDELGLWLDKLPLMPYADTPDARGVRLLRNVVIDMMLCAYQSQGRGMDMLIQQVVYQYEHASCMSEKLGALTHMVDYALPCVDAYVRQFYAEYQDDELIIDSWFSVQALSPTDDVADIRMLMARDDYDWSRPNRVRAVLSGLSAKPAQLWTNAGLEVVLSAVTRLDGSNPVLASRLLASLDRWYTLVEPLRSEAYAHLNALKQQVQSKNVLEFLDNILSVK